MGRGVRKLQAGQKAELVVEDRTAPLTRQERVLNSRVPATDYRRYLSGANCETPIASKVLCETACDN